MPPPSPIGTVRVLPIQLQIGDRLCDEAGEWEVVGRPQTTAGGKETRLWGSYERVTMIRRASAEEGK